MTKSAQEIRSLIEDRLNDRAAKFGIASPRVAGVAVVPLSVLLDVIAEVAKDGLFNKDDLEAAILMAEELFETYVRPFDIPGIGPIVEKYVDDALKGTIRPVLTAIFDRFVK